MEDETPLGEEIDGGNDNICTECGGNGECFCIDKCPNCGGWYEDCHCDEDNISCDDDELDDDEPDESMDGDAQSALASAGWGTDEDYGYFGGDE